MKRETLLVRAALLVTACQKMRTEDEYVKFVRDWRAAHDVIIPMILEHKEAARHETFSGHHQAMAMKYGKIARQMYGLREYAKDQLKGGAVIKTFVKQSEPA